MIDYASMGRRIRESRKKKNLTQEQLAEKVNISPTFLSMIETGMKPGSFDTYMRIAIALDVTLDYLSQDIVPKAGINEQVSELLDMFHTLEPSKRRFVLEMVKNIKNL